MKALRVTVVLMVLATISFPASAQDGFFYKWEKRVRSTMAQQPPWAVPLFAPASTITQLFRYDIVRQITPAGTDTWNYGFSKGLDLVPWYNTEVDMNIAPYIQHHSGAKDGFGDLGMSLKYRLASANLEHRAYSIAVSLAGTIPTGSYKNGGVDATLTPRTSRRQGIQEVRHSDQPGSDSADRRLEHHRSSRRLERGWPIQDPQDLLAGNREQRYVLSRWPERWQGAEFHQPGHRGKPSQTDERSQEPPGFHCRYR
jgi:hypothetical protein